MAQASELLTPAFPAELARWSAAAALLTEGVPPVFRADALVPLGWVAVAVEDELEGDAAARLAQACIEMGPTSAWAIELPRPPANWTRSAFRVPVTAEGLEAVGKDGLIGSAYVLVEDASRFAVASSGDLYWMLAGPRKFIEAALGASVTELHKTFRKVVDIYGGEATLAGQRLGAAHAVALASDR